MSVLFLHLDFLWEGQEVDDQVLMGCGAEYWMTVSMDGYGKIESSQVQKRWMSFWTQEILISIFLESKVETFDETWKFIGE